MFIAHNFIVSHAKARFNTILLNILGVQDKDKYAAELARGTKPTKAAIKCGAQCSTNTLNVMASAKLAVTQEEIDLAYSTSVKSCMQGEPVGSYYNRQLIGVIWTNNFRVLLCLRTFQLLGEGYGYHNVQAQQILMERGVGAMPALQARSMFERVCFPYLDWWSPQSDYGVYSLRYMAILDSLKMAALAGDIEGFVMWESALLSCELPSGVDHSLLYTRLKNLIEVNFSSIRENAESDDDWTAPPPRAHVTDDDDDDLYYEGIYDDMPF